MRAFGYVMAGIASLVLAGAASAGTMDKVRGAVTGSAGTTEIHGVVKEIDDDRNEVTIESQGRQMELELSESALSGLSKGDNVVLTIGIREASGTQHGDAPSGESKTGAGATPGSSSRGMPDSPTGDR